MKFYTNFFTRGNKVFVRGYTESGIPFKIDRNLSPVLYTETKPKKAPDHTDHTNIYGDKVWPNQFETTKLAREFLKSYSGSGMRIWGYPRFDYSAINEMFPGVIEPDYSLVRTIGVDIETEVEHGPIDVVNAPEVINLITLSYKNHYFTFGCRPYTNKFTDETFTLCSSEADLLSRFITLYSKISPDVITGWNVSGFDLPYLYNRITRVCGADVANTLSPYGWVSSRTEVIKGKESHFVDISGVSVLDYLELYRKFELSPRENYKLDTIAKIEVGETKTEFDCTFKQLYTDHWDTFVVYNIQDVRLIDKLEAKLGFISLAMTMAHAAKCNFSDVYRVTRIWDNIIANYLSDKKCHVIADFHHHGDTYEGAFVKPTIPGLYEWCASFDVASLYPSLILGYNISPETILPARKFPSIRPDDIIEKNKTYEYALQIAKDNNATLCANGALFSKEKRGFIPELVEAYMKKRKAAKSEMKKWQGEVELVKAELNRRGLSG